MSTPARTVEAPTPARSPRPSAHPAHSRLGLTALVVALVLAAAGIATAIPYVSAKELVGDVAYQTFTVVGALLYLRVPRNPIGPLFLGAGVGSALASGTSAVLQQVRHGALDLSSPLIHLIGCIQTITWLPTFALPLIYVSLLFPDGTYLSPRWRRVGQVAGVVITISATMLVTLTAIIPVHEVLAPTPTFEGGVEKVLGTISTVGLFIGLGCGVLGLVSLFLRYRRSGERVREQVKLVVFAAVLAMIATLLDGNLGLPANLVMPLGVPLIAVAVAVAVTRYRLYDIDRLVSRTLSYAAVTAVLVGFYVGCVALTTQVLPFSSSLGVAASTLVAAAAFQPLRRRVQHAVDRRFNRARYDAEQTLDDFARNVRRTVDPAAINAELVSVLQHTVEPSTLSLWVAPSK